ncbi:T9SS type A sorting domain-containing protein [uncultured Hymenobacter sp.]|uniref:T9SS type A sorting domain-containing protein n=1 Tax=uncultured Hymenobacter sp. TaxID=170016 RepID=UPI0035C9C68E
MKHFLLALALGYTLTPTLGVAQSEPPARPAVRLPVGSNLLDAQPPQLPTAARPATTVRVATRISTSIWDQNNSVWLAPTIRINTYNAQDLLVLATSSDSATQRPLSRTSYAYNATRQNTNYLNEVWNGSSWQNSSQTFISYDTQGRPTQYLDQEWANGAWVNKSRSQYGYTQNYHTQFLSQNWTNGAWVTIAGYDDSYVFDAAGRLSEVTYIDWNSVTNTFVPSARFLHVYNGSATLNSGVITQNPMNATWVNAYYNTNFTRDAQSRVVYSENQTWTGTAWQLNTRANTMYAATGPGYVQLTERLVSGSWVNNSRYTDSYDSQNQFLGYSNENWMGNSWETSFGFRNTLGYNATNDVTRRLEQSFNTNARVYVNSRKYYYSNFQSITLATKLAVFQGQATLHPNPSNGSVTLTLDGLRTSALVSAEIINTLGQVVLRTELRPQSATIRHKLNLASLPAGVYSVCVRTAEGTITKRLVRE